MVAFIAAEEVAAINPNESNAQEKRNVFSAFCALEHI